jgi:hypothetical protein
MSRKKYNVTVASDGDDQEPPDVDIRAAPWNKQQMMMQDAIGKLMRKVQELEDNLGGFESVKEEVITRVKELQDELTLWRQRHTELEESTLGGFESLKQTIAQVFEQRRPQAEVQQVREQPPQRPSRPSQGPLQAALLGPSGVQGGSRRYFGFL